MSSFCSQCGKKYGDDAKFCNNCGNPRRVTETPIQQTVEAVVQTKATETITGTISLTTKEANEIATSLIYSAGALLPFSLQDGKMSTPPEGDDLESIKTSMSFLDKLFKEFPDINKPAWLGYSEYQRVKSYLNRDNENLQKNLIETAVHIPQKPETESTENPSPPQENNTKTKDSTSERVLSTIIDVKTIFPSIYFILFLTQHRIIAARKGVFDSATEAGAAMGGILGAIVGAGLDKTIYREKKSTHETLSELSPDEILAYDKSNFEIKYSDIKAVELVKPGFLQDGEITILEDKRKFDWIFEVEKDEFQVVIDMFNNVIPKKVKVK